jgi:hypothetical protein
VKRLSSSPGVKMATHSWVAEYTLVLILALTLAGFATTFQMITDKL